MLARARPSGELASHLRDGAEGSDGRGAPGRSYGSVVDARDRAAPALREADEDAERGVAAGADGDPDEYDDDAADDFSDDDGPPPGEPERRVLFRRLHLLSAVMVAGVIGLSARVAAGAGEWDAREVFGEPEALEPAAEAATEWTFEEVPDEPTATRPLATAAAAVADALFGTAANATEAR